MFLVFRRPHRFLEHLPYQAHEFTLRGRSLLVGFELPGRDARPAASETVQCTGIAEETRNAVGPSPAGWLRHASKALLS